VGTSKTVDVFDAAAFRAIIAEKRPADVSKLGTTNTDWQKQFIEKQILLTTIFL
jgi:iron complex outermembrane receptor protein